MHQHQTEQDFDSESRRHSRHDGVFDSDQMADVLEVEGDAASGLTEEAIALCAGLLHDDAQPVGRIIDFGCGPGVGTTALAEAFPSATVVAVDGSSAMLERTEARAARLGLRSRAQTHQLNLNDALSILDPCDLAWAAMAIHHVEDEVATLRKIGSLVKPGGLLCVLEREEPTGIRLEQDLARPGIWDRLEAARLEWFESVRANMPGANNAEAHASMLSAAGFEVVIERTLSDAVEAPRDYATRQFIARQLLQTVRDLADFADSSDLQVLQVAAAEPPDDVTITSSRKLLIGRPHLSH